MKDGLNDPRGGFVKSYGCQMNVYDSSRIAGLLGAEGYGPRDSAEDADVIVLNTCHIREKAADKVFSELGQIRALKEERAARGRRTYVGVAGCVAQAEGAEILRRESAVDFVIGPQAYHRIPEALARAKDGERSLLVEFETEEKFEDLRRNRPALAERAVSAFLTIQEGCDKFCSFCVVPYTRGSEVSRSPDDIFREAQMLADRGVCDITLLGQNVNAYKWERGSGWSLAKLFEKLSEIRGIERLRYTTSHPRDMSDDLIAAHRDLPKVMPYLHLPVQSGSDAILRAMNRKHTSAEYLDLIDRVRGARPDIALSSDFIVGFPGETDVDFRDTMKLVREVRFAGAFSFMYSKRAGTPGAELDGQVPEALKRERLHELQAELERQRDEFNSAFAGRRVPVLFEKAGRHPGQIIGKTPYLQSVHAVAPDELIGTVQPVLVEGNGPNSLKGRLMDAA